MILSQLSGLMPLDLAFMPASAGAQPSNSSLLAVLPKGGYLGGATRAVAGWSCKRCAVLSQCMCRWQLRAANARTHCSMPLVPLSKSQPSMPCGGRAHPAAVAVAALGDQALPAQHQSQTIPTVERVHHGGASAAGAAGGEGRGGSTTCGADDWRWAQAAWLAAKRAAATRLCMTPHCTRAPTGGPATPVFASRTGIVCWQPPASRPEWTRPTRPTRPNFQLPAFLMSLQSASRVWRRVRRRR